VSTPQLVRMPAAFVEECASALVISDKESGATIGWEVTEPQRKVWREIETGAWLFFAKPRQAYFTTAVTLDDVLWCWANDERGNRVRCAFVIHTADATRERAEMAKSFITQLGLAKEDDCNSERCTFRNGSELVFITAGGKGGAGRSGAFQRAHCSELPFWPTHDNPLTALQPTIAGVGQIIIETTMDVTAPNGLRARALWRKSRRYRKVFTSLEENPRYRADPRAISDEEWAQLSSKERGYTDRAAAAWWKTIGVEDCENDEQKARREYPQREEDMFSAGAGRYIPVTPRVTDVVYHLELKPLAEWDEKERRNTPTGIFADIRRRPSETSQQLVAGIDTGKGVGRDWTVIVIVDKRDGFICATLASNQHDIFEFARLAASLLHHYTTPPVETPWLIVRPGATPEVVVEENSIGEAMVLKLRELGVSLQCHWTDDAAKFTGLGLSRQAIINGEAYGPAELADECDELHQNERGEFVGRKDMLMALGFTLIRMRQSPYDPPTAKKQRDRVVDEDEILEQMTNNGAEW
jgi:hypothetical protein